MGSPKPVPFCLVVKKGSNTSSTRSAGIPGPVSLTRNSNWSPVISAEINTSPPPGIAWIAFSTRLSRTCFICSGSHQIGRALNAGERITNLVSKTGRQMAERRHARCPLQMLNIVLEFPVDFFQPHGGFPQAFPLHALAFGEHTCKNAHEAKHGRFQIA